MSRLTRMDWLLFCMAVSLLFVFVACSDDGSADDVAPDGDREQNPIVDGDYSCPEGYSCSPCTSDVDCDPGMLCDLEDGICKPSGIPGDEDEETPDGDIIVDGDLADSDKLQDTDGRRIVVEPTSVDFGAVQWGRSSTKEVVVSNEDAATLDLEIQDMQFVTEGALDFSFEIWNPDSGVVSDLPISLAPGKSLIVKLTYSPTDEIDDAGEQLLISSNDGDRPIVRVTMNPQYKGEAKLVVSPDPIAFGDIPIYSSSIIDVTISNQPVDEDTNRVLKITNLSLQNGQYVDASLVMTPTSTPSSDQPVFLIPGDSISVKMEYSPAVMGTLLNGLFLTCNDPNAGPVVEIPITGKGVQADLAVIPTPIDFGARRIGETHFLSVEIANVGNESYPIEAVSLVDENPLFALASITPDLPWLLLPSETATINVSFSPEELTQVFDKLWLQGGVNDEGERKPDYFIDVKGSGSQALIRLEPADVIDFGNVQHGQTEVQQLRVYSEGNESLTISSLQMSTDGSADFAFTDVPGIYESIPVGQSRLIDFTYTPDEGGLRSSCKIFSNAGNAAEDGSVTLQLQGSSNDPIFFAQPDSIEFDSIPQGDRDTVQVMVKNIGNGSLTIYSAGIDIGSSPYYGVENFQVGGNAVSLPLELGQSQTMTFDAFYEPYGPGEATGALSIVHNDYDEFGPGDLDRTEHTITLHASGPANTRPVAVLRANYSEEDISLPKDAVVILDGVESYDDDEGDTIADYDFTIDTAPAGHNTLEGTGDSRHVILNAAGDWIFSLRVQDSNGEWSSSDTLRVTVTSKPVAVIRANTVTELLEDARAGAELYLDTVGSVDPDGGNIMDWEFRIDSLPAGATSSLTGSAGSRSIFPDRIGTWTFMARVQDDEEEWSDWATVVVDVIRPQTIDIVMQGVNTCWGDLIGYRLFFESKDGENCGPSECLWGPRHSGNCNNLGNNEGDSEIIWDYSELLNSYPSGMDGEYHIRVERVGFSILLGEHVTVALYVDGEEQVWWDLEHDFGSSVGNNWDIYLFRHDGLWEIPHNCVPGGCL